MKRTKIFNLIGIGLLLITTGWQLFITNPAENEFTLKYIETGLSTTHSILADLEILTLTKGASAGMSHTRERRYEELGDVRRAFIQKEKKALLGKQVRTTLFFIGSLLLLVSLALEIKPRNPTK